MAKLCPVKNESLPCASCSTNEILSLQAEINLDDKKIYSFLSIGWGLLADIDVESEVLRSLGESRFTMWSFYRLINLRRYQAKLTYVPTDSENEDNCIAVVIEDEFLCIYAVVQSYIGSDLYFAPDATRNDGVIHLVFIRGNVGRVKATQFLTSIDKGKSFFNPYESQFVIYLIYFISFQGLI